ncbi:amidase [Oceanicola sp. S124]|uniref:amidase n=1 Tax=Oceanicola sp. S124 TaxID=1042378 RepID=UPI00025584DC|nr:amidase [Oceanicola sp. S124]
MTAALSLPPGPAPLSAVAMAEGVRAGRLDPLALRGAARLRGAEIAGLQAVAEVFDPPLATHATGPLAGVPMLVKDLSFAIRGQVCANGSAFPAAAAPDNALLLDRYLAAGAQVLGRSHSPEFGGTSSCESRHHGLATRNPYAPHLSSGGSSGGAAVAVATGMVPLAHASDAGGSITIPAALCGVVGLKPTHDLIPLGPERSEGAAGFAAQNVLSRDIEDTALALAVGAARPELARIAPPQPLRLGLVLQAADRGPTDPQILSRLHTLAASLRGLGHEVTPASLPPIPEALSEAERDLRLASLAATVAGLEEAAGQPAQDSHFEPATWARLLAGRAVSGARVLMARQEVLRYRQAMAALFDSLDVVLCPALNAPAPALHALSLMRPDAETRPLNRPYTCFARPWNLTGYPSLCLPLLRDALNRPEGALFAAAPGQEGRLLSLGLQLQQAIGWQHDHLTTRFPEGALT